MSEDLIGKPVTDWNGSRVMSSYAISRIQERLEKMQQFIKQHPWLERITEHPLGKKRCEECMASEWVLVCVVKTNDVRLAALVCTTCGLGGMASDGLPKSLHLADGLPIYTDNRSHLCERCGYWGTEVHHWAPREVFGRDAESWPTSHLCRECHQEWHRRMNEHASQRRAA